MEQEKRTGNKALSASSNIRFGPYELDLRSAELRKDRRRIRLQEQPFLILVALLERPGEIVLREEIRKKLWPDDTVVEFDHGINAAVKRLRDALCESIEKPRYIETLARKGYRFIGTVEVDSSEQTNSSVNQVEPVSPANERVGTPAAPRSRAPTLIKRWLWVGAAGGLLAAGMAAWFFASRSPVHVPLQVTRLTFDSRLAWHPAISSDGKYIAYASDRGEGGDTHIWVQELPTGEPVRVTKDEGNEDYPSFSADGSKIAFRSDRDGGGLYAVPLLGGESRLLALQGTRPRYSPDGRLVLFFSRATGEGGWEASHQVFLSPAEGGERRPVPLPVQLGSAWVHLGPVWREYSLPVFSADARQLLYLAQAKAKLDEISTAWYIVPLAGGASIRAGTPAHRATYSTIDEAPVPLAWLRGNRILYRASSGDAINLWLATLSAGDWRLTKPPDQLTFGPVRLPLRRFQSAAL